MYSGYPSPLLELQATARNEPQGLSVQHLRSGAFRHFRSFLSPEDTLMELSAVLSPDPEGGYVAFNPETGTTTQGASIEEALANLREATELFLEEFPLVVKARPFLTTFEVAAHA